MADGPTLAERILGHLVAYPTPADARDVPREITQDGISEALGARVAHVSRGLKGLIENGRVNAHLAHPRGSKRRSRAYTLTDDGYTIGKRVRDDHPDALAPQAPPVAVAGPAAPKPPAGRQEAFDALVAHLDAARSAPRVVLVEGDAGSGKSRLLDAFAGGAAERGARVAVGRSVPVGDEQLLGPLRTALDSLGFNARVQSKASGSEAERALAAALDVVTKAAAKAPVVIVLDDLHHAGAKAAEFLHGFVRALPADLHVLVVAAFRREEAWALPNGPLYTALDPLRSFERAHHLDLDPLDQAGIAALFADLGAEHPASVIERVWQESGGNAFYAVAMAQELADGVDEEDFFPAIVAARAKERFADLPAATLGILQTAAVAGAEFPYAVLANAVDAAEDDLVAELDVLLDRLLLEEAASDGEDLRLRFEHPKVRDAVLAGLSATKRRLLEEKVRGAVAAG